MVNKDKNVQSVFGNNDIRMVVVRSCRGEPKGKGGRVDCKFLQVRGYVFVSSNHLTYSE